VAKLLQAKSLRSAVDLYEQLPCEDLCRARRLLFHPVGGDAGLSLYRTAKERLNANRTACLNAGTVARKL
jgi:hypothetical protein